MEHQQAEPDSYSVFISGELIDLCVPSRRAIDVDGWADWFNRSDELLATRHGIFPNHQSSQVRMLDEIADDRSRLVLLICTKPASRAFGVISLQSIDQRQRSAEIAIVTMTSPELDVPAFAALEAMARVTQHGFEHVGLNRIYAGQAYPRLGAWSRRLEVVGYRPEGINRHAFVRGRSVENTVSISCILEDYAEIVKQRGSLWGSLETIRNIIRSQPKVGAAQKLDNAIKEIEREHFQYLFNCT